MFLSRTPQFAPLVLTLVLTGETGCVKLRPLDNQRLPFVSPAVERSLGRIEAASVVSVPEAALEGHAIRSIPNDHRKSLVEAFLEKESPEERVRTLDRILAEVSDVPLARDFVRRPLIRDLGRLGRLDEVDRVMEAAVVQNSRDGVELLSEAAKAYMEVEARLDDSRRLMARAFSIVVGYGIGKPPPGLASYLWRAGLDDSRVRLLVNVAQLEVRSGNHAQAKLLFAEALKGHDAAWIHLEYARALEASDALKAGEEYSQALALSESEDSVILAALERLRPAEEIDSMIEQARAARPARLRSAMLQGRFREELPEFKMKTLGGEIVTSDSILESKVVVMSFFASWCGPCLVELPELQKIRDSYRGRTEIRFLLVGLDEELDAFTSSIDRLQCDIERIHEPSEELQDAFEINSLPAVIVIGQDGRIEFRHDGSSEEFGRKLRAQIEALLADTGENTRRPVQ